MSEIIKDIHEDDYEFITMKENVTYLLKQVEELEVKLSKTTDAIDEFLFNLKDDEEIHPNIRESSASAYQNFYPTKK
jgi:hypothetical protein